LAHDKHSAAVRNRIVIFKHTFVILSTIPPPYENQTEIEETSICLHDTMIFVKWGSLPAMAFLETEFGFVVNVTGEYACQNAIFHATFDDVNNSYSMNMNFSPPTYN
jgi:hypothetical protein